MCPRGNSVAITVRPNLWFDWILEGILITLLAFGPLAFGAVHAWSEQVVVVLAAILSVVFGLRLIVAPVTRFVWTWTYLPLAVFLLLAVLQIAVLPASAVRALSPHTASLKTELLSDLPNARELLSAMTLSFYPHATRHDLRLVLAAAAVFVVVVNLYHDPARIRRLLTAITVIGGGVALLALAQDLAGNGKIYWVVPTFEKVANSGPFINHSHYGQFMNLSIGAALALLAVRAHETFAGRTVTTARVRDYLRSPRGRTTRWLSVMMIGGAVTVFLSLTRGGAISLLLAAGFTLLMLSRRPSLRGRGWTTVLLAMAVFLGIVYLGFDEVCSRLTTLRELHEAEGGRWQIIRDIALVWTRFPFLGIGLGTHQVVYPMFDRSTRAAWAMHAENEYAQAAEETGLAGLLSLALFGLIVWRSYARSVRASGPPIRSAAYGLGFGLLAILIHSLSDFGQHLPANALLSAVFCGLLIALTRVQEADRERPPVPPRQVAAPVLRLTAFILIVSVGIWAYLGANRARIAEAHWNKVLAAEPHFEARQWRMDPEAQAYLFSHATAATAAEPDNIQYRHWLCAYKWLSLTTHVDPNTDQLNPEAVPWARQIVQELHAARPLCPTFGATCCLAGEIEKLVLMDPAGVGHIRTGYRLAPCDAASCFAVALCDVEEGRPLEAFEKLSRAVQLDGGLFPRAVRVCVQTLHQEDWVLRLAGDDPRRLAQIGDILATSAQLPPAVEGGAPDDGLADRIETMVVEQLRRHCDRPGTPALAYASLARLYGRRGDTEAAIRQYRRAVMKDYDRVDWHYALALSLAQAERSEEAIHEARVCLRLRTDHAPAKRLIERLSVGSQSAPAPPAAGR